MFSVLDYRYNQCPQDLQWSEPASKARSLVDTLEFEGAFSFRQSKKGGVEEMIDLRRVRKSRKSNQTIQDLIEGMVETLLDHGYSVNEVQELTSKIYLLQVTRTNLKITKASGDIVS